MQQKLSLCCHDSELFENVHRVISDFIELAIHQTFAFFQVTEQMNILCAWIFLLFKNLHNFFTNIL